ncbi:hypothetical protein [Ruminococcus sp.]|uniref:hypothetical protein n=1 Tax=Ruminococcus sp. TaxID=41978 RepID=UPI0025F567C2|nr:hypothetical protein [Ruminococcus sp.]
MAILEFDNIKSEFMGLCGLDEAGFGAYEDMLKAAANAVENDLDVSRIKSAEDRSICEFAAATEGFFRFVCQRGACDKVIVTAQGKAVEKYDEDGRIKAAMKLRDSAAKRAERFAVESGFAFCSVTEFSEGDEQ